MRQGHPHRRQGKGIISLLQKQLNKTRNALLNELQVQVELMKQKLRPRDGLCRALGLAICQAESGGLCSPSQEA